MAVTTLLISLSSYAMNEIEAKNLVKPFYDFLNNPTDTATAENAKNAFEHDWKTYYSNNDYKGLEETIKKISYIGKLVPNLTWEIKQLTVAGNTITVRSEATGKPTQEFFGVPHTGGHFKIMAIDIHHVSSAGKIKTSYHVEDWAGAIKQLKSAAN